jgi:hypothetical protein
MLDYDFKISALAGCLLGLLIISSTFFAARLSMIPGHPKTFSLLYSDGPIFRSSLFSPLSSLYGRLQWYRLAHSKGLSSTALADQIIRDGEITASPSIGTPVCSFDRVVIWNEDCLDNDTLKE